jgi:hypothetical protein
MTSPNDRPSFSELLRKFLKYLSLDWITVALDLAQRLRRFLCVTPTGPYEILDYEATVELLDTAGKKALFKKRQRVKFLQNNVIAFEDYAWGDGEIFSEYRCKPGVVVDRYQEGDRWNILISLRATKSIGDVTEFHIERTEENTFTKDEEWLQTEIRRRTRRLQMNVFFPRERYCLAASVSKRSSSKETVLGPEHFHLLPDGRQLVSWETDHVDKYDVYTLKWKW